MSEFWVNEPKKPPPGKGIYLVQRLSWGLGGDDEGPSYYRYEGDQGTPLFGFRNRKAAEACCRQLEQQARREVAPFDFYDGELELLTSLSPAEFPKALRQLGLKPPTVRTFPTKYKTIDWPAWWAAVAADLSDAQRQGVFELLDQLHFYEVIQAEIDGS
jgi:hypothetical protein